MKRILVISARDELVNVLHKSLAAGQVQGRAAVIRNYPSPEQLGSLLRRTGGRTLLIDLAEPGEALKLIAAVHTRHPEVVTLAVHTENSPDLILSAIRAGAAEYLGPPFTPETLERALLKQSTRDPEPRGRVVAFLPAVGGSGASTAALHVAANLAKQSQNKAVLIDMDFHSSSLNLRLRLHPPFTLADCIERIDCIDELWDQLTCDWEGIRIMTAAAADDTPSLDYRQIPTIFESASKRYQWVVADLPAALFSSCNDVLQCCDAVYIVCTTELASLHHARKKAQQIARLDLRPGIVHLLVNRLDDSLKPVEIEQIVGMPVGWALRNDYKGVNAAYLRGRLVPENSALGRQIRQLAEQIMGVKEQSQAPAPQASPSRWRTAMAAPRSLIAACPTI